MATSHPNGSALPPLHDRWVTEILGGPAPGEPLATCSDCAMCGPTASGNPPSGRVLHPVAFDPDARCCTYQPHVWNFLAGAALADRSAGGAIARDSIIARMRSGSGATPLGLTRSRRYAALAELGAGTFGRAQSLRCPHYIVEGARCAIWTHRESTCATWFCKHEHGAVSKRFWDRLQELLRTAEEAVARHALLSLDIGADALAALAPIAAATPRDATLAELEDLVDPERDRLIWGRWADRETEFYQESARIAAGLTWADVRRLGGAALDLRLALLDTAYAELSEASPPARLRVREYSVSSLGAGDSRSVLLGTYSGSDPLEVPAALLACLAYFDGRPTADAIAAAEDALSVSLETALVRRLYEFGVLEAVR